MSGSLFAPAVDYDSGGYGAISVAVADVNADGKPDLVVANNCGNSSGCKSEGTLGVLLDNGDGTFQTAVTYDSGGYGATSVAIADVNGDGKPDLLVVNACGISNCDSSSTVGVLLGNGDGTFQTAVTYGSGGYSAWAVAVADVNGDGRPDLVVANKCDGSSCSNGTVGVLLGNGDGTFQTAVTYGSGGFYAQSVAATDVNGDGKLDLLVANNCVSSGDCSNGTVGVLLGNGDGTFQTAVNYSSGGYEAVSAAVADVNGDGKPDLIVANDCSNSNCDSSSTVGVLVGNGDGTFQAAVTYGSGGFYAQSVAIADVNGDGNPDLVVANLCGTVRKCGNRIGNGGTVGVLLGNGDGTFQKTMRYSSGGHYAISVAVADVNGDGKPDLVVANACGNSTSCDTDGTVGVLINISQPIVKLSPPSLNFGNQTVDITSNPQNVTLKNIGNVTLKIASIGVIGTNSGDFAQTNNCPSSIPPSGTCKIKVTFRPSATGTRNAAASITDNAPGSPQSVPLTGVGVLPAVTFSPTSLTFPDQVIFTTSPVLQVTLTNSGAGVLKINHIGVTSPFQQTNNCPSSLGPGANCTISVKFRPGNKGVFHGAVSVTDNASGSPQKVPLTGTGTFVQLIPATLNFGTQPVGTRSLAKKITLTNKGDSTVKLTGVAITGTDAGDFAENNTCGESVASGASCFIKVTFKPLAKGKRTANVSVYDNGGGSPQEVKLIGTGT